MDRHPVDPHTSCSSSVKEEAEEEGWREGGNNAAQESSSEGGIATLKPSSATKSYFL